MIITVRRNPLSVASLAEVFSHSVGSLFALFRVSFALKKLLSLLRSHWYVSVLSVISLFAFFVVVVVVVAIFWAAPAACGGSQANWSCSHRPRPEPQQRRIRAVSAACTTAYGNAGSLTH